MTRKRYVKLFMALGVSRNAANRMADNCRAKGIPYAVHYSARAPWLTLGKMARMTGVSLLNLSSGARTALQGCADSVARMLHHLNAHPSQPITPETLKPGNMLIVTAQKHAELHGYSAKVSFVDELHTIGGDQK